MNMLSHNLKIALRNLWKYKVQTLVSILALAIGMVALSMVHAALEDFRLAEICGEPYYDRVYTISFDSIRPRQSQDPLALNGDIVRAMKSNGGLGCVEQGPYAPNGLRTGGWAEFTLGNGERRKMQIAAIALDKHYPHFAGFHSALTGEKIKELKLHEAIISQSQARQIFGDVNPVGARLRLDRDGQSYQLTVVDVYQELSNIERVCRSKSLFFSPCELEDMDFDNYYAVWMDVVLKPQATPKQLETEANARLKPLGLKANVENLNESMSKEKMSVRFGVSITYLIGSLILLAAIISFLRMQTQLFWMRRREISLRVTNGATRCQLFFLFATEVTLVVVMACWVAIGMEAWVHDFLIAKVPNFVEEMGDMGNLYPFTIGVSVIVLALCLLVVWGILLRICKSEQGLDAAMRRSHGHWFRNMMLGVQIVISTFFLCATFDFLEWSGKASEFNNIPKDESVYKESLYLHTHDADDKQRLRDHLVKLPEVEKYIPYNRGFYRVEELAENEEFCNIVWKYGDRTLRTAMTHYQTHFASDVTWLNYMGVKVNWKPKVNRTKCVLVNEKLYQKMRKFGVAPNEMLTIENEGVLPISGTYSSIPYQNHDWNDMYSLIVIDPKMRSESEDYILVPKPGEYEALKTQVEKIIKALEPAVVNPMVTNLRSALAKDYEFTEVFQIIVSILAVVSFVICLMSIFSTLMLDTRARRREVAIRKVNGALMRDIARLFGKTYVVIGIIGIFLAVVLATLFHLTVMASIGDMIQANPVLPFVLGVLMVVFFIAAIVAWQVRRIMSIDPSEILAKE